MAPLTKRLNEIEERLTAATPGPWGIGHCSESDDSAEIVSQDRQSDIYVIGEIEYSRDQRLICRAPTDLAFLIEALGVVMRALHFYGDLENYNVETGAVHRKEPRGLDRIPAEVLDFGSEANEALTELDRLAGLTD